MADITNIIFLLFLLIAACIGAYQTYKIKQDISFLIYCTVGVFTVSNILFFLTPLWLFQLVSLICLVVIFMVMSCNLLSLCKTLDYKNITQHYWHGIKNRLTRAMDKLLSL